MKVLSVSYRGDLQEPSIPVGRLAWDQGKSYFEYRADFLQRALPLSPLQLQPHSQLQQAPNTPFAGLHGVFNDSLPDGWGLYLMDKHLRKRGIAIEALSPVDRLAWIGDRAMGALSYEPDEGESFFATNGVPMDLDELARESIQLYTGATEEVLTQLAVNGTPSGGARPKVLLGIREGATIHGAQDLPPGFEHWIAKFPTGTSAEHKAEGSIEYIYSQMATEAGIDFPATQLVQGRDGNAWFLIKRFDRLAENQRVHMHSLAGLVNANFRIPDFSYEQLFHVCRKLTNSHAEVKELFRRMLFNVVTGNRDDHTKNFSFLMDETGNWRNSPAYDVTYNRGMQGEHSMLVGHSGKDVSRSDISYLAESADIPKNEVKEMFGKVLETVSLWKKEAAHYAIPKGLRGEITGYMEEQSTRLSSNA